MQQLWNTLYGIGVGIDLKILFYALGGAVILLIAIRSTGLMRRTARWHNGLVKIYYLYIPLVFMACGGMWAGLNSLEKTIITTLEEARPLIIQTSVSYSGRAWNNVAAAFAQNPKMSLREMTRAVSHEYTGELMQSAKSFRLTPVLAPVLNAIREGVTQSLVLSVEETLLKHAAGIARLDPALLHTLWNTDIITAMHGGLVYEIIISQTKAQFPQLYHTVRNLFILFMLPVILETGIAMYLQRRSRKKEAHSI